MPNRSRLAPDQAERIMRAVNDLSVCTVAMDDANQSLPPGLDPCGNGMRPEAVFFGVADTMRRIAADLRDLWGEA